MSDFSPHAGWCETLYEDSAPRLVLYGRSLGLSHAEAEDVLHEVFTALLSLPERPEKPGHYLVRAIRNRALNFRRSLFRRIAREFESARWFEPQTGESHSERAALRCLQELPAEQREVIVLKIWHEHTFEEIASILDVSPNTAAGRYRYGIRKLRTCLQESEPSELHELERSLGNAAGVPDPA